MGGASPGLVVLSAKRNQADQVRRSKPVRSTPLWSLLQFLLPACVVLRWQHQTPGSCWTIFKNRSQASPGSEQEQKQSREQQIRADREPLLRPSLLTERTMLAAGRLRSPSF